MYATQADERDETKRNENKNKNEKRDRKDNNIHPFIIIGANGPVLFFCQPSSFPLFLFFRVFLLFNCFCAFCFCPWSHGLS